VKKIGRYNRKIGVCIGGSDSRNFAHLCYSHLFYLVSISPAESIFRANIFLLNQLSLFFLFSFYYSPASASAAIFLAQILYGERSELYPHKSCFPSARKQTHTPPAHTFFIISSFGTNEKKQDAGRYPYSHRYAGTVLRMRSILVVRASDCQCTSCNGPEFDPSIRRHSIESEGRQIKQIVK
jgi:hypothetical protein